MKTRRSTNKPCHDEHEVHIEWDDYEHIDRIHTSLLPHHVDEFLYWLVLILHSFSSTNSKINKRRESRMSSRALSQSHWHVEQLHRNLRRLQHNFPSVNKSNHEITKSVVRRVNHWLIEVLEYTTMECP